MLVVDLSLRIKLPERDTHLTEHRGYGKQSNADIHYTSYQQTATHYASHPNAGIHYASYQQTATHYDSHQKAGTHYASYQKPQAMSR
ncbi:hypothetical protein P7K49_025373 [Saguinus oedipus]|uniref:Uncharacterized protein n=1 Tax=Saguinus oedipus TaxID=9490 RepID=A0ABQ9UHR2_SAGOE|nr:hypothetical protein P7K49_025373 [Saguinus oedipus]